LGKGGFLFTHKVTQGETPLYQLKDTDRAAEILKREEAKDYQVLTEIPFWSNGAGFTSGQRTKLCHYSVKSGKVTELTGDSFDVSEVTLDEDKCRALIIGREAKAKLELPNDVLLLQIKSKKTRKLETGHTETQSAQFMEGNRIFLLINEARQFGLNENASFFLYELESGELTKMVPDQDISVGSSVNSDMRFGEGESVKVSGGWIYYIETNDTDALLLVFCSASGFGSGGGAMVVRLFLVMYSFMPRQPAYTWARSASGWRLKHSSSERPVCRQPAPMASLASRFRPLTLPTQLQPPSKMAHVKGSKTRIRFTFAG